MTSSMESRELAVNQLLLLLNKLAKIGMGDRKVLLAADPEGNSFRGLTGYSGQYHLDGEDIGLGELDEDEDDLLVGGEPVVILWP